MLEALATNLWILLTLVIPGLFTYGAWRIILILQPSTSLAADTFNQIDGSALLTASIITAIALGQQAVAIAIEAGLAALSKATSNIWPNLHLLFCERFALAASKKLDENATRIVGNFFLSVNVCIGLGLLLLYFIGYESMKPEQWIPRILMALLAVAVITAVFRMINAKWAVAECKYNIRK
jgi:hypothetical protein